jgi:hypothetical protein
MVGMYQLLEECLKDAESLAKGVSKEHLTLSLEDRTRIIRDKAALIIAAAPDLAARSKAARERSKEIMSRYRRF